MPLGVAPTTGMGLAVNGGFSIMSRMNGLTCDNTLEVQMVLADGSVVSQPSHNASVCPLWLCCESASHTGSVVSQCPILALWYVSV